MRRSNHKWEPLCHWCKTPVATEAKKTAPEFTDWPDLPSGTGVVVCAASCPKRPEGAPVGSGFRS